MGSAAKVILVGACSLIVGVYATSLKTVQTMDVQTSLSHVNRVQTERVADAALRTTMERFTRSPYLGKYNMSGTLTALGGGTISYSINSSYPINGTYTGTGTVTYTAPPAIGGSTVIDVKMDKMTSGTSPGFRHLIRGQWQVTKYHVHQFN